MLKQCSKCKKQLSISEFHLIHSKPRSWCKSCQAQYVRQWYLINRDKRIAAAVRTNRIYIKRNREYIKQYKSNKRCLCCNESDYVALDFHHRDPLLKKICVSALARRAVSIELLHKEIDKCILLCANCHRKLHAGHISLPSFI